MNTNIVTEPIEMQERRYGYFPARFTWRGQAYRVTAVEHCWTDGKHGRERHCFRVRCAPDAGRGRNGETFEVYRDALRDTWHLRSRQRAGRDVARPTYDKGGRK